MKIVLAAAGVAGLAYYGARRTRARIKNNPAPFSVEDLLREPEGDEVFVERDDGTRIRALVAGDGPTVVLAHGFALSLVEWSLIAPKLVESGFRIIAFDQRGHGRSTIGADGIGSEQMAGDYAALLEHFDVRDAVLVGHSMGGFLAIKLILESPELVSERLRGLVLLASTAGDVLKGSPQNHLQGPLLKLGLVQKVAASDTFGWGFNSAFFGRRPSPAAVEAFSTCFCEQNLPPLLPIVAALSKESYYPQLDRIHLPTIVMCGKDDRTTPPWHSRTLGTDIPEVQSVWLPEKGHMLNWEAPVELIEAVESLQPEPA